MHVTGKEVDKLLTSFLIACHLDQVFCEKQYGYLNFFELEDSAITSFFINLDFVVLVLFTGLAEERTDYISGSVCLHAKDTVRL